jgi:hypothetical protein
MLRSLLFTSLQFPILGCFCWRSQVERVPRFSLLLQPFPKHGNSLHSLPANEERQCGIRGTTLCCRTGDLCTLQDLPGGHRTRHSTYSGLTNPIVRSAILFRADSLQPSPREHARVDDFGRFGSSLSLVDLRVGTNASQRGHSTLVRYGAVEEDWSSVHSVRLVLLFVRRDALWFRAQCSSTPSVGQLSSALSHGLSHKCGKRDANGAHNGR